jgi:diguanylate cyclase (GGDEF)-like protein
MGQPADRLLTYGSRLLLEHTQSLIALIDQSAGLIAWNNSLAHWLKLMPGADTLLQLLALQSRPRCLELIAQALAKPTVDPIILNFANGPTGLPSSYHCHMIAIPTGELIVLAEPIAALDQQAAEQYLQLTNDLAITTRSLQKTRYALEKKQHLLEDALLRLEQLVHIDDLTQLLNRRSIMQRLAEETDRSKRYHSAVSVLLIDIDHFKQINDMYGHQAGDQVLQLCASLLQRSIRTSDYLGRYGGEEFLGILPMTSATAAVDLAERLRRQVECEPFTVSGTVTFSLTVSVGVAEIDPQHDTTELLIAHADSALYEAKAQGRNCYALWHSV